MKRKIYLDNAATTYPYPEVVAEFNKYLGKEYGNPGGKYEIGDNTKEAIASARALIASTINANPSEIYFTSGGTESDNLALFGYCMHVPIQSHIITSAMEHKAILKPCHVLEDIGIDVTYLKPDERGWISPDQIRKEVAVNTKLISLMLINNEIGVMSDAKAIGKIAKDNGVVYHCDAVQAYGHTPIDVKEMGIDMLSASSHKFHGIKGCGFLYISDAIRNQISPIIIGGSQENGLRAGTENVPGIMAMAKAAEIAHNNLENKQMEIAALRDHMIERILHEIPKASLNGSLINRAANNVNVRFDGVKGDSLLTMLDMCGVYASTGSACNSNDNKPSHVLKAMGLTDEEANSSIRFTLSEFTDKEDIDVAVDMLKNSVEQLRFIYEK